MGDRPINLRDWQVRAAVEGRLAAIVVPIKPPKKWAAQYPHFRPDVLDGMLWFWDGKHDRVGASAPYPIAVGDRLWVREAWKTHSIYDRVKASEVPETNVFYRADNRYSPSGSRWRSSTQMPRWASRFTLIPTSVRVCRLQDVTEDEARAAAPPDKLNDKHGNTWPDARWRIGLAHAWTEQHGADSWERNPWACIARVDVIPRNIDSMEG